MESPLGAAGSGVLILVLMLFSFEVALLLEWLALRAFFWVIAAPTDKTGVPRNSSTARITSDARPELVPPDEGRWGRS